MRHRRIMVNTWAKTEVNVLEMVIRFLICIIQVVTFHLWRVASASSGATCGTTWTRTPWPPRGGRGGWCRVVPRITPAPIPTLWNSRTCSWYNADQPGRITDVASHNQDLAGLQAPKTCTIFLWPIVKISNPCTICLNQTENKWEGGCNPLPSKVKKGWTLDELGWT